jgi:NADPH:quinone reductase
MKAIQVTRFGGPDVLVPGRMPDPVAGPGEAVISVAAADVLFLDTAIRSGQAAQWFPVKPRRAETSRRSIRGKRNAGR